MTKVDQFESVFRAAAKTPFAYGAVEVGSVLVVSDEGDEQASTFGDQTRSFLSLLDRGENVRWTTVAGGQFETVPHLLDQYWWGKRIMNMGLAPAPLPRARLTADRLRESIASVLGNEFLSDRAREVGEQIAPDPTPRVAADKILACLAV